MRLAYPERRADVQRSFDARKQRADGVVQRLEAERGAGCVRGHANDVRGGGGSIA